jgi:acetyl esterase
LKKDVGGKWNMLNKIARTKMKSLLILAILCFFSNGIFCQEIRTYKETEDGVKLFLSVHKTLAEAKENPAIVFFHGGGYSGGSPIKFARHTEYFVARGLTVVNVQYRIRKVHNSTPMQSVSDGKAAIRYVRSHARALGIHPNKIIAAGGSAGGHLASACALLEGFEEDNDKLEVSCVPNALVLYNPVFKIETKENGGYKGELVKLFPDHSFSPWHNIKKGAPPTVVFLGTQDKHVPVKTVEDYKQKMDSVGSRCDLFIYEGQKHGFFNYREDREAPYFIKTVYETDKILASLGYLKGEPSIEAFEFGELTDPIPQATEAYINAEKPEVLGLGKNLFCIGDVLFEDKLNSPTVFQSDWLVQMNDQGDFERYAKIKDGKLEVLDPSGCTIWFREKLQGPVCISYKVVVSSERDTANIIRPRDINNFWMAGEIGDLENILDSNKYTGKFSNYHEMQGYYASMGGGSIELNNRTHRMRIYPRVKNKEKCEHLALISQDDDPEFKIIPGKEYQVQLLAFNDLIQFIVNNKLVYEIKYDMAATATTDNNDFFESRYVPEKYPVFNEGYFGLRMTHSFHKYSEFKVFKLEEL